MIKLPADRDRCERCRAGIDKAACRLDHQTDTHRETPPPAGSAEEYAETARVAGYSPGLGSCVEREE